MSKTIVWIEDDISIIKDVVQPMIDAGYKFVFKRSIKEATDELETLKKADLILLDLIYPVGYNTVDYRRYPGVVFLEMLRKDLNIHTPVVVFTVVTRSEAHDRLMSLGVTEIVNKPVRPSRLKTIVEETLGINN